jgi:hypothetical protein
MEEDRDDPQKVGEGISPYRALAQRTLSIGLLHPSATSVLAMTRWESCYQEQGETFLAYMWPTQFFDEVMAKPKERHYHSATKIN